MSRLPFEISVAQPCTQRWSGMTGSNARRHCESCNKQVHNFAAMTAREIGQLVAFSDGHLCGRISREADGQVITAAQLNRPVAARIALAASLSIASLAGAQSTNPPKAVVTGILQPPDPKLPTSNAMIAITQGGAAKSMIKADPSGAWRAELDPGIYDIQVFGGINGGELTVNHVVLHSGEQGFGVMQMQERTITVTAGGIAIRSSFLRIMAYRLRHPIQYITYLSKRTL
jgi:hypothetical protein